MAAPARTDPTANADIALLNTLRQRASDVHYMDKSGTTYRGFTVWCDEAPAVKENPEILFAKCLIMPESTQDKIVLQQVEPKGYEAQIFNTTRPHVWNTNMDIDPLTYGDMSSLTHTNYPCMLDFARQRYMKGVIYTTAEPLLIAINPYEDLGNATEAVIKTYRDTPDMRKLAPHVFLMARQALENLHSIKKNQTIIVSGESGAGKTEATKQMMRYFAAAKTGTASLKVQEAVMAANPLLEAFGNAKTVRNNNSSRFGRFMVLDILKDGGIAHGKIDAFLLEKSRVITQDTQERSYHVFYQLLKGASADQKTRYGLRSIDSYTFLNPNCLSADGIDDAADFANLLQCFDKIQLPADTKDATLSALSGILLLGNVKISSTKKNGLDDAAEIAGQDRDTLDEACRLLFLDASRIYEELTVKRTIAGKQEILGSWTQADAEMLKVSLAKAMYEKMFMVLIDFINKTIEGPNMATFIAMLDIFGFELFENNSLEQFFINATNEMLQQNFVNVVFERETKLYKEEGLQLPDVSYTTNQYIMDAMMNPTCSILSFLEDQCLAPGGSDEKLVGAIKSSLKGSKAIVPAKKADNIMFVIAHTIGPIQYCASGFIFKNRDVLRADMMSVIQESSNPFVQSFFAGVVAERGKIAKGQLIGSQFYRQLMELMRIIRETESHFVRCVKPNEFKKPKDFNVAKCAVQFLALSIFESVGLSLRGYSYHRVFHDFLIQYQHILPGSVEAGGDNPETQKKAAEDVLKSAEVSEKDYRLGKTMVFMKQDTAKQLSLIQRSRLAGWSQIIASIEAAVRHRTRRDQLEKATKYLIRLTAHVRRVLKDSPALVPPSQQKAAIIPSP